MLQKSKRPEVRFSEPYRRDRSTHLQHLAKAKVGEKDETSPVSRHASKCSQDILEDAAAIVPSTVAESSQIRPSLQLCAAVLKARHERDARALGRHSTAPLCADSSSSALRLSGPAGCLQRHTNQIPPAPLFFHRIAQIFLTPIFSVR